MVQVWAHLPSLAGQVRALAQESDAEAERRGVTSLGTEITRGSKLTFELVMRTLRVWEPVQELVWNGSLESVQFELIRSPTRPTSAT